MIHDGLSPREATDRFYAVSSKGLLVADVAGLRDFQRPYARAREEVRDWVSENDQRKIELAEVFAQVHPTILIGTSTDAGAFTESIVKDMAAHTERPIILPLSNPTSKAEAVPADLIAWTGGRVFTAPAVRSRRSRTTPGRTHRPGQQRVGVPGHRPGSGRRQGHPSQ